MNEQITNDEATKILTEQGGLMNLNNLDFEIETKIDLLQRERSNAQWTLKEWKDVITMRRIWSYSLLGTIVTIVGFDFFVILSVGYKWMIFDKGYIVPFFVGESLIKTLGLALIVVKFLFNEKFISKK